MRDVAHARLMSRFARDSSVSGEPMRAAVRSPATGTLVSMNGRPSSPSPHPGSELDDGEAGSAAPRIGLRPLATQTLTDLAYVELRRAVAEVPIYDGDHDGHLDERALAAQLGISRTPVREALLRLESEGIVQTIPRRGVYVVRKTKDELIEVILASAALEGMAARLAAARATDAELGSLRSHFLEFSDDLHTDRRDGRGIAIDEYSKLNVEFHQHIVDLARSDLFSQLVSRLQLHMRAVRRSTMGDSGRFERSVVDHTHIIEALERRDADLVERHVRQHAVDLAEHVRRHFTSGE